MMRPIVLALLATVVGATAAAAQYTPAGTGLEIPPERREELEKAREAARLRLGPFWVRPVLGVRDLRYVDDVDPATLDDTDAELTATLAAGLKAYLPIGQDSVLTGQAVTEYVWWSEHDERNELLGRYGLGWFGFFNRLNVETTARYDEKETFATPELLERVPVTDTALEARGQLRLGGAIGLFGSLGWTETDVEAIEGVPASLATVLDREVTRGRAGLRYLFRADRGHLGAGVQVEETRFDAVGGADRSNEGTSPYLEILLRGNRLSANLDLAQRSLEPLDGSRFAPLDETTGSATLDLEIGWRLALQAYGRRDLAYSFVDVDEAFLEERWGLGARSEIFRGGAIQIFHEEGTNDYLGADAFRPDEDVTAWGVALTLGIRRVSVSLAGSQTTFGAPGRADREVREVGLSIGLTGDWSEW